MSEEVEECKLYVEIEVNPTRGKVENPTDWNGKYQKIGKNPIEIEGNKW